MTDTGITWPEEGRKYQATRYQLGQAVPPPNWADRFPEGYTEATPFPDLSQDEHFQVWMRTAGLPTFRKLYYRNDNDNMVAGRYSIDIFTSGFPKLHACQTVFIGIDILTISFCCRRLSRCTIQRHQVSRLQHSFLHRRAQSIPRYRVLGCCRYLRAPRPAPHTPSPHQAPKAR
jgi:hypothetical protein